VGIQNTIVFYSNDDAVVGGWWDIYFVKGFLSWNKRGKYFPFSRWVLINAKDTKESRKPDRHAESQGES
jgi:hypothetical protein